MSNNEQPIYKCSFCNYNTFRKNNLDRHFLSSKHKIAIISNKNEQNEQNEQHHISCNICNKSYKTLSGLWRHKKSCYNLTNEILCKTSTCETSNNHIIITNDLIIKLLNDNKEMRSIIVTQQEHMTKQQEQMMKQQNQISELIPKVGNNIIQNNNNNKFNIQVFLNEKCKDAINMSDFVKSIQVSFQQLDFTKQNGIVSGLTNVIIENMNKLGLYERPIHCTDIKRESVYIKDDDIWIKDVNKEKIKKAIKGVSTKQFCALSKWTKENPDFIKNESKNDYYTHTLVAIANNKESNEDKIIKKLCLSSFVKEYC